MKRLETLKKEARRTLDKENHWTPVNGVDMMDIARAMDKLRDAERVLRKAFDPENA